MRGEPASDADSHCPGLEERAGIVPGNTAGGYHLQIWKGTEQTPHILWTTHMSRKRP
jgi:hypothetical protein